MTSSNNRDFSLCSSVCKKITEKFGGHTNAADFPEAERNVVLSWTASGIIENGGFRYLFGSILPGDPFCVLTVKAFELIGCTKAASALKNAVCLFPNCEPPLEKQQRIGWFENQPEEIRNRLDTAFWDELNNITLCLAKYIRETGLDQKYN